VVSCQVIPELLRAYERLIMPPPLIEYGNHVAKALTGIKHFVNRNARATKSHGTATLPVMAYRSRHVLKLPSMVDMAEYDPAHRAQDRAEARAEWGLTDGTPVIGWMGRLDRKQHVEDFIEAAACVRSVNRDARFVIIGSPDANVPEYASELRDLAKSLALGNRLRFLGDRADIPRLLAGLDIFVWLSQGEGMPQAIAEAGAAGLPVITTREHGSAEHFTQGETALFVPPQAPGTLAASIVQLLGDQRLRHKLGQNLHAQVQREHSTQVVIPRWQALFEELAVREVVLRGVFAY
jgi:glycosyltransferase involved in cell wall biosynthesis